MVNPSLPAVFSLAPYINLAMLRQPNTALTQLVQHNKRYDPPIDTSIAPVVNDTSNTTEDDPTATPQDDLLKFDNTIYDGLVFKRMPHLEKHQKEHARGARSWIYLHG
jgi:hypothetical protein